MPLIVADVVVRIVGKSGVRAAVCEAVVTIGASGVGIAGPFMTVALIAIVLSQVLWLVLAEIVVVQCRALHESVVVKV